MPTLARPDVDVLEGSDDRDPRRPGADGLQPPHRRSAPSLTPTRCCASSSQPARQTAHRLTSGVLVEHRDHQWVRCGHVREGRQEDEGEALVHVDRRHVRPREGRGTVSDFDLSALYDDTKSLNEGALSIPGYSMDGWYGRIFRGLRLLRPGQADPQVHQEGDRRPALPGADQDQGRRDQPDVWARSRRSRSRSSRRTSTRCSRTSAPSWSAR